MTLNTPCRSLGKKAVPNKGRSDAPPHNAKAQVVKVTPNYLLVEIVPGVLAMVPKGEFDPAKQYSPGEEVEVTLLTINQATRRITGSIQHVADIPLDPTDFPDYAPEADYQGGGLGTLGQELAAQQI